jgi:hypothetical protein
MSNQVARLVLEPLIFCAYVTCVLIGAAMILPAGLTQVALANYSNPLVTMIYQVVNPIVLVCTVTCGILYIGKKIHQLFDLIFEKHP